MPGDEQIVILYVPSGSEVEAVRIATTLVSEHLIACANIYRSRSIYRWEGKPADETEYVLIAKTTVSVLPAARERIEALHSYDVPCIISIRPDTVNDDYARWVSGEVAGQDVLGSRQVGEL